MWDKDLETFVSQLTPEELVFLIYKHHPYLTHHLKQV